MWAGAAVFSEAQGPSLTPLVAGRIQFLVVVKLRPLAARGRPLVTAPGPLHHVAVCLLKAWKGEKVTLARWVLQCHTILCIRNTYTRSHAFY